MRLPYREAPPFRAESFTCFSIREFRERMKSEDALVTRVLRKPRMMLVGNENELRLSSPHARDPEKRFDHGTKEIRPVKPGETRILPSLSTMRQSTPSSL